MDSGSGADLGFYYRRFVVSLFAFSSWQLITSSEGLSGISGLSADFFLYNQSIVSVAMFVLENDGAGYLFAVSTFQMR